MIPSTKRIGLIGIGLVGSALAEHLVERGYVVAGYDIDAAKLRTLQALGCEVAGSPADVASRSRIVVLSLVDSAVVREVVEGEGGPLSAAIPPHTIVDTTTGDPLETVALAERLTDLGIAYLDATISGSSDQIRHRAGIFMVGGDRESFDRNRELLAVFSDTVHYLGPAGSGARAKLATNLVLRLNRLALAEGLVFGESLGLDLEAFLSLLKDSPAYSMAMDTKGRKMLQGDFRPEARLRQHLKDVELILKCAAETGQTLPLTAVHRDLLAQAMAVGDGDLDNSAVIREIRRHRRNDDV